MRLKNRVLFAVVILFAVFVLSLPSLWRIIYPLHYQEEIFENAAHFKIDPYLIAAVIKIESNFDSVAISPRGAKGLMQIMPETGLWIAEQANRENFIVEDLFDPAVNIHMGTWYLSSLLEQFNGNLPQVLAAYNAGRGRVNEWLRDGVWDGTFENRAAIPYGETRAFVRKVLQAYEKYRSLYISVEDSPLPTSNLGRKSFLRRSNIESFVIIVDYHAGFGTFGLTYVFNFSIINWDI